MKLILLVAIILLSAITSRKITTNTAKADKITKDILDGRKNDPYDKYSQDLRKDYKENKAFIDEFASKLPKSELSITVVKANELIPTQAEIDFGKSVSFSLFNPYLPHDSVDEKANHKPWLETENMCKDSTGAAIKKKGVKVPIIIAEIKGKLSVLDGHHRWSQFFLVNPNCQIYALKVKDKFDNVDDALKSALYLQVMTQKFDKDPKVLSSENASSKNEDNLIGGFYADEKDAEAKFSEKCKNIVIKNDKEEKDEEGTKIAQRNADAYLDLAKKNIIELGKIKSAGTTVRSLMPQPVSDKVSELNNEIPLFKAASKRKQKRLK